MLMLASPGYSRRQVAGAILLDLPRLLPRLCRPRGWVRFCNRQDRLATAPRCPGVNLPGYGTSPLHACQVFPWLGQSLMRRALQDWPMRFAGGLREIGLPDVSFVIPHRGSEREPLLLAVIASIFGQAGVRVECIVVEQDAERRLHRLPPEVRHLHLPHPADAATWRKCWAFNEGVAIARAPIVICHDGDILVPARFAQEVLRRMAADNLEVLFPQRFLFYLTSAATDLVLKSRPLSTGLALEEIRQNWKGGTLAIRKRAYWQLGGFDEQFTGWTGEDIEFYDRSLVLKGCWQGYIPFIHLWHPPQPLKISGEREKHLAQFRQVMEAPRAERIARLRQARRPVTC